MAKVLLYTLVFTPDGVSNAYLYRDLVAELESKGHQITVLTTTPHYNLVEEEAVKQPLKKRWGGLFFTSYIETVKVIHIPMFRKSSKSIARIISAIWFHIGGFLAGLFIAGRQDVVIASSPPLSAGLIGATLAQLWNASSIYIVQDVFPDGLIRQGKIRSRSLIRFLRTLESLVYRSNDRVVVIAQSFYETLKNRVKNSNKLCLIANFVDTDLYRPSQKNNKFSEKYIMRGSFIVSYVGNIGNAQDFTPVICAAQELKNLPIQFIFAGDGIRKKYLEDTIRKNDLQNVISLGYIPRDLTPLINSGSDICLVLLSPHVQGDGFPSKIFTIMACARTAIITADEGSDLTRVVRESGCGDVVPVGDSEAFVEAIKKAYNCRDALIVEGERARDYVVNNYSKEVIGSQYNKLINELCSESQ